MMRVERIQTENGSHIKPACKNYWSPKKQLEWYLAVLKLDHPEIDIEIYDPNYHIDGVKQNDHFGFTSARAGASSGAYSFDEAWVYLNGVSRGMDILKGGNV